MLEAVVALAIVGVAGVAALEAAGSEFRAAARAQAAYVGAALAADRLAALTLARADELTSLADSLARGTFPPPFAAYTWTASVRAAFGEPDLYEVAIAVRGTDLDYAVATRLYRPAPRMPLP
jgi:type II secretory pathway pseudopilin PulG